MAGQAVVRKGVRTGDFLAGKYLLEDVLGAGGMGEVYRATNISLGRKVAIKIMSRDFVESEDDVLRFLREARAAAAVHHPNVVDVLDVARDDDGTPFIVQEVLSGEDLEQHAKASGGRLAIDEVLKIMIPVTDAIAAAHEKHLVHRDLKPANVFLSREGDRVTPKVLDFGAALYTVGEISKKEARMLIGTPHYMAPEQITAKGSVDARADVWAIGIMLYELLVGQTPFEAATTTEVMRLVRTKPVPKLGDVGVHVPPELEQLVAECTAADRTKRLPDAAAVRKSLIAVKSALQASSEQRLAAAPATSLTDADETAKRSALLALGLPDFDEPPPESYREDRKKPLAPAQPPLGEFGEFDLDQGAPAEDPAPASPTRSSLPPVLDPRAATRPAASERPPPSPAAPLAAPIPQPSTTPAIARRTRTDGQRAHGSRLTARGGLELAAAIVVPALVAFVALRFAGPLTAPLGRAMRGDSMIGSGVLSVVALVTAAALAAKTFSAESRAIAVTIAAVGAGLLGIVMIIVTFSASEAAELGEPSALAAVVPFLAPIVPIALGVGALKRALEAWPGPLERREARLFAALASLALWAALEVGPLGVVHTLPPPPRATSSL